MLLGIAYYLAARLGLGLRFQNTQIGVVWPANAVLLSALLLSRRSTWWLILLTVAVAHIAVMGNTVPAWRIAWQIAGNSLFVAFTAEVIRHFNGLPLRFESARNVFTYAGLSFSCSALYALTTPGFERSLLELETAYTPATAFLRTTLSNATAMLLVVPFVVSWAQFGRNGWREISRRRIIESVVILSSLLLVGGVAFGSGPSIARLPWLLVWTFPPLLWVAVRLGPTGASTSLLCIAALSLWGTARSLGPFALDAADDIVLSLQLFWIVIWPPIMVLAAAVRGRANAEAALHDQRNQLAHVTRVATAGELSGALAHQLRQPLASILANAEAGARLLAEEPPDIQEARTIFQDIARHDRQAADFVARLRTFMQRGTSRLEPLSLEVVIRDALALSRSRIEASGVEVEMHLPADLPQVRGDGVQLLQVLVNLVVNACESMSTVSAGRRRLRVTVGMTDDNHIDLSIADAGTGLPEDDADRVFEPFFTTKAHGLGLGLAIGRSIAVAHGGHLWAEDNTDSGATFHLRMPTYDTRARGDDLATTSAAR